MFQILALPKQNASFFRARNTNTPTQKFSINACQVFKLDKITIKNDYGMLIFAEAKESKHVVNTFSKKK